MAPQPPTAGEFAMMAREWNSSLDTLDRALMSRSCAEACTGLPMCNSEMSKCACGHCHNAPPSPPAPPLLTGRDACSLLAVRHVAKTGGVSIREWMLEIERTGGGHYYGPATWMKYRGRCDGQKRFLHCCHPTDPRSGKECKTVKMTRARALAVSALAAASTTAIASRGAARTAISPSPSLGSSRAASSLAMLEFHWPDSALGPWGEPHTFLQMLPRMRPFVLPGCRVVVATVLRDPMELYPSLQRHQYDAMREYGRIALQQRCGCNLTSCDVLGFVRAFPNFQGWRLTSSRWLVPPLSEVGHAHMLHKAGRLLQNFDLVGVVERLDEFVQLLCRRVGISPCTRVAHRNAKHFRESTRGCSAPDPAALAATVQAHAAADIALHRMAAARFAKDWGDRNAGDD